jgi:hypothetical protein
MNCTNCGKEIPEGEEKICEECKKNLLEELSNEKEKTEELSQEKKKEGDSKKEKKEDEFKVTNDKEKNSKLKFVIAGAIIVIIIAVASLIILQALGVFSNKIGNTIGNIRNYGYGADDGKYIYYLSPNEDSSKVGIYKVKNNGKEEPQELFMEDIDILSINYYKNHIYFIGVGAGEYNESDEVDNKIYRMKKDGSDLEVINDNNFNNDCYEIYVLNNSIYYIGADENIYKMNLDGTNAQKVADNGTGYIGITNKYILYNVANESGDNYITYIMNLDGTNGRPILENKRLYSVDIENDYIYYTNTDKQIYRTKVDSGEEELILDTTAYNLNLKDGYLYYLNYLDAENEDYTVCLYRVKADGTEKEPQKVKQLSTYSSYINVVGDWVMYLDHDDESGFINLVNKNMTGTEKKIYNLEYAQYYDETIDESSVSGNTETPVETTPETPAEATNTEAPVTNTAG